MVQQYFAQIDENNIVTNVHVVTAEFMAANPERYTGTWVETFFDTASKTYAGIGYEYLESEQDFRTPQPYPSWTWANKTWNPPTPMPLTGGPYEWSEEDLEWVAI
jgi:hypothetical protein